MKKILIILLFITTGLHAQVEGNGYITERGIFNIKDSIFEIKVLSGITVNFVTIIDEDSIAEIISIKYSTVWTSSLCEYIVTDKSIPEDKTKNEVYYLQDAFKHQMAILINKDNFMIMYGRDDNEEDYGKEWRGYLKGIFTSK